MRVVVGRVFGSFGLRGQLRVRCFGDPADLAAVSSLVLAERDDDPEAGAAFEVARFEAGRRSELRVALVGVDDRDAADALRGRWVFAAAAELSPTAEEEYYGYELIGCTVEGEGGETIGTVRNIWSAGGPDLLVVVGERGAEHLVPMAREILREVDVDARRIAIAEIPGLLAGDAEARGAGGARE